MVGWCEKWGHLMTHVDVNWIHQLIFWHGDFLNTIPSQDGFFATLVAYKTKIWDIWGTLENRLGSALKSDGWWSSCSHVYTNMYRHIYIYNISFPQKNILNLWVYIPNVQTEKHHRNRVLPGQFDKCDLRADLESRLYWRVDPLFPTWEYIISGYLIKTWFSG